MDPAVLDLYIGTFAARTDAYVRDSRAHVNDEITRELVEVALTTLTFSMSGYLATTNDGRMTSHVAAIDFDSGSRHDAEWVRQTLQGLDIPTLLVDSRRGAHLWLLTEVFPAATLRHALEHAVKLTSPDLIKGCEIFPKRSASPFGAGALRMPLMRHPKTGLRYSAWDLENRELTTPEDLLLAHTPAPRRAIERLTAMLPTTVEYPRGLGAYRRRTDATPGSVTSLLQSLGAQPTPGRSCLCPFHDDQHRSLSVADDDQRVWCKTPECDAYNGGRGLGTLGLERLIARQGRTA